MFEDDALKRAQPRRIEMLDDFDNRRGIEVRQSLIPIRERPVNQFDARTLKLR